MIEGSTPSCRISLTCTIWQKHPTRTYCVSPPTHTSSDHATRAPTDITITWRPCCSRVVGQTEGSRRYAWIHGILAGRRRIPRAHTCTLSLFLHIVATTFESRHLSFYTHVILQHGSYASSATLAEASLAVCKATFSIPTESQHTFQLSSIADLTWKANSKVPTHLPPYIGHQKT